MSLAGLDAPTVVEAHQASIADSTGWFVIKYATGSRDTIELFKKGVGGVNEARKVVEAYEEKSPLYGLVQYRRRKIILKYVPDGTSRVLQVRLAVQFQSVLDALTPHDTVFSFTQPSELTESALAVSTMLLPSTGSITSSTSSLRRRRLNEISEDAEDDMEDAKKMERAPISQAPQEQESLSVAPTSQSKETSSELPASALRAKALLAKRKEDETAIPAPVAPTEGPVKPTPTVAEPVAYPPERESLSGKPVLPPITSSSFEKSLPAIPIDITPTTGEGFENLAEKFSPKNKEVPGPEPSRPSLTAEYLEHSRYPSGADGSSISQWSSEVAAYASVKPKKKKLGPRPHVENSTRPRTSGASETTITAARPVANLPTSVRISNNRSQSTFPVRPGSQQSSKSVPGRFSPPSANQNMLPPLPSPTYAVSLYRPETRPIASTPGSATIEAPTATPEKLRLMKALQLRKKNMLLAQRMSASTQASFSSHAAFESPGSSNNFRAIHPSGSTVKSELNGHLAEPTHPSKLASSTTSPTTTAHLSEEHSTKASSFSSHEEAAQRRASLSSDTSSSMTPKAGDAENKKKKRTTPRKSPPAKVASPKAVVRPSSLVKPEENLEQPLDPQITIPEPAKSEPASSADEIYSKPIIPGDEPPTVVADQATEPSRNATIEEAGPAKMTFASLQSKKEQKNRLKPAALRIASSGEYSEMSDNDSLMDELQNATVQEAKPISVARTPVTPVLSKVSPDRVKDTNRTVSTPITKPSDSTSTLERPPKSAGGRSFSTALPQWPPQGDATPVPLTKKATLGSSISKRIKALEVVSTRQPTSPPQQPVHETSPATRSAFSTFLKRSSLIIHQQTPNTSTETSPLKKLPSPTQSPRNERAREVPHTWKSQQEAGGVLAPPPKGETVSVTARIIRDDPEAGVSQYSDANDYMYRSPLIVEHERQNRDIRTATSDGTMKSPKSEKGRFSFSSHRSQSHPKLPSESLISKMTFSGSRNKVSRSTSDGSSIAEERPKSSRAGRLMKRVSNLAAGRRSAKDLTSPSYADLGHPDTIEEDHEREFGPSLVESLLHVVDIGDVNVQFPDSLLWKRRFIRIDDQGYLIFSPPANEANAKAVSRKYHLGDFKQPALPDAEREEMANSVILDMKTGSTVQCACESKASQQQVLQMLVDAHSAYHQLYSQ